PQCRTRLRPIRHRHHNATRLSAPLLSAIPMFFAPPAPATRNHRHADRGRDHPRELNVKALACTLPVYGCDENLASAKLNAGTSPLDSIDARAFSAAICVHLPLSERLLLRFN